MPIGRRPILPKKQKSSPWERQQKFLQSSKGEGKYLYKNTSGGTLLLPKPALNGAKEVNINGEWEGDSYFMMLVKSNMAILIKEITSPEEERKKEMINEEKLILDQPDCVTSEGTVEQVVKVTVNCPTTKTGNKQKKKIVEQVPDENEGILLTEDPLEGVQILG